MPQHQQKREGCVVGVVGRAAVERAVSHELGAQPLSCVVTNVFLLPVDASMFDVVGMYSVTVPPCARKG